MGSTPPASPSAKAEQIVPADLASAAKDLHFDDDDYDSDFPESKATLAAVSVETYTLADVLALVQEGLSQNAHNHSQLLNLFSTLERNLSKRIDGKQQVQSRPAASARSSPVPSITELIEKNSECIAKLKETNVKPIDSDVTVFKSLQSQLRDATASFETDVTALITEFKSPARSSPAVQSPQEQQVTHVKPSSKIRVYNCTREAVILSPSPKPSAPSPPSPLHSAAGSVEDGNEVYFPCDAVDDAKVVEGPSNNSEEKDEVDIYADMPPLIALTPLEKERLTKIRPINWLTATTPVKLASAVDSSKSAPPLAPTSPASLLSPSSKPFSPTRPSSQLFLAEIEKQRNAMDRLSFAIRRFAVPPCTSPVIAEAHAAASPTSTPEQPHQKVPASISLASFIKQSMAEKASENEEEVLLPSLPGSPTSPVDQQETCLTAAKAEVRLQEQARQLSITERVLARRGKTLAREQAHLDAEKVRLEVRKAEMDLKKTELERREREWQRNQHAELVGMREQMARLREQIQEHEEHKKANEIPPAFEDTTGDDYFKLLRRIESDEVRKECQRLTVLRDEALKKLKEAIAEEEMSEMERID